MLAMADHSDDLELAPLSPGAPTLVVRDLGKATRFYEDAIGLRRIDGDRDGVRLGAGGPPLLVLRGQPEAELEPARFAGLFHTAFLVPSRADLGAWLAHALKSGVDLDGASDHQVSEALYLCDPEGNGIEIYADRPRQAWKWISDQVVMTTDQLDVRNLLAAGAAIQDGGSLLPDGTRVGHIHLRVGGIPEAERFYRDALGLAVTSRRPGATFYSSGGYHHHLATNTWHSQNAPKRSGKTTGLASFELLARDRLTLDAAGERLLAIGGRRRGGRIEADDPWGNTVQLLLG